MVLRQSAPMLAFHDVELMIAGRYLVDTFESAGKN